MKKVEILPAVLPKDFAELEEKAGMVNGLVKMIQLDVCDGRMTQIASWPYRKHDDEFEKLISQENGLPQWKTLNYEIDLMVDKPEEEIEKWVTAGANNIVIHAESKGNISEALDLISGWTDSQIGFMEGLQAGLALNIDTPIDVIEKHKDKIQFIQLMGIDRIGFQGEKFDVKVIDKIKSVRGKYPDLKISIDGGVSLENAEDLVNAGANKLIVGSAIFGSDNYTEAVADFKKLNKLN